MSNKMDFDYCRVVILNHFEKPTFKVKEIIPFPNGLLFQTKKSASCSDFFEINIFVKDHKIQKCQFTGSGCVISTSSLDILLTQINNRSIDEAIDIIKTYFLLLKNELPEEKSATLGDLNCFNNIYKQTNRVFCASIGAQVILENLNNEKK